MNMGAFNARDLMAEARSCLIAAGYNELEIDLPAARVFENSYNVVTVVSFETWSDLARSWLEYQAMAAEAMTSFLTKNEMKSWDGYLVLLTPSPIPAGQLKVASDIRGNTSRLRKLLSTGEDIKAISDVRKVLLPVLPIAVPAEVETDITGLDLLPSLLEDHGIAPGATIAVVEAFKAKKPILQRLHEYLNRS